MQGVARGTVTLGSPVKTLPGSAGPLHQFGDACTKSGDDPLQGLCGGFDSHRLHQLWGERAGADDSADISCIPVSGLVRFQKLHQLTDPLPVYEVALISARSMV